MEAWRVRRRAGLMRMMLIGSQLCLIEQQAALHRRCSRRIWVREILGQREEQGDFSNLIVEMQLHDHEMFFNYMRMMPETFENLLALVGPKIKRGETNYRETIAPAARLSMTIRYLASGDSMASIAFAFRVGRSTVVSVIPAVCEAIWKSLNGQMLQPSTEKWLQVSQEFEERWNFPHCIGALDGKHVVIIGQPREGSTFYNYKGHHSVVLMALASASYKFLIVDIGAQGRHSDGGIFRNSDMGQRFIDNEMSLPNPVPLSDNHDEAMPYVMVADEAFQLNTFTLRPYPGRNLSDERRIFNYRLSRARRVVENAFGIMASRWRIYSRPMNTSLSTTENIVKATVCLHNYMMPQSRYCGDGYADTVNESGQIIDGAWREELTAAGGLGNIGAAESNTFSRNAAHVRSYFMDYFMSEGAVPWQ